MLFKRGAGQEMAKHLKDKRAAVLRNLPLPSQSLGSTPRAEARKEEAKEDGERDSRARATTAGNGATE